MDKLVEKFVFHLDLEREVIDSYVALISEMARLVIASANVQLESVDSNLLLKLAKEHRNKLDEIVAKMKDSIDNETK